MKYIIIILTIFSMQINAKVVNFDEALDIILKIDTHIPTMRSYLSSSKTQRLSKALAFAPTLDIGHKKSFNYEDDYNSKLIYLSSNLNLFKGGSDYSAFNQKRYAVKKYKNIVKRTELDREKNAVQKLVMMILKTKKFQTQQKMVAIKLRAKDLANSRYRKGWAPQDDVLKAEVELKNSQASLDNAGIELEEAQKDLSKILGDNKIITSWPWIKKLRNIKRLSLNVDSDNHPRIKEIKNSYNEELNKQKYYRGLMLPRIDFNFSWQRNEVLSNRSYDKVGTLTLSWNLFDGLSKWSNYKTQSTEKIRLEYSLVRERRDFKEEVKKTENNLLTSIRTAKEREETLKLSRKLYKRNVNRYRRGKLSITDLEWEQNRLLTSENMAEQGWAQVHLNYQNYCYARGRSSRNCL